MSLRSYELRCYQYLGPQDNVPTVQVLNKEIVRYFPFLSGGKLLEGQ